MKNAITLFLLLTSISFVSAQSSIGLHFGIGVPNTLGDAQPLPTKDKISKDFGVDFQYDFHKRVALFTSFMGLTVSETYDSNLRWGTQHNGLGSFDPSIEVPGMKRTVYFFSTQVGMKYYFLDKKIKPFVQPYVETNIFLKDKGLLMSSAGNTPFEYTLSMGVGFGVEMSVAKNISLYVMPDVKMLFGDLWFSEGGKTAILSGKFGMLFKL